jgi:hypothetical protein
MRSLTLAFAMLPLVTVPTLAAPCQVEELQKKVAALPDFVVVKKGEKSLDALSRALGCELPAPQLPTLASGEKIKPAVMIGKNIFSAEGKNSEGVIKDVVVDKENLTVSSVNQANTRARCRLRYLSSQWYELRQWWILASRQT